MSTTGEATAALLGDQKQHYGATPDAPAEAPKTSRLRRVLDNPYFRKFVLGIILAAIVAAIVFIPGAQVVFGIAGAMSAAHGLLAAAHFPLFAEILTVAAATLLPFSGDVLGRFAQGLTWLFVRGPAKAAFNLEASAENDDTNFRHGKKFLALCARGFANLFSFTLIVAAPLRMVATGLQWAVSYLTTFKPGLPTTPIVEDEAENAYKQLFFVRMINRLFDRIEKFWKGEEPTVPAADPVPDNAPAADPAPDNAPAATVSSNVEWSLEKDRMRPRNGGNVHPSHYVATSEDRTMWSVPGPKCKADDWGLGFFTIVRIWGGAHYIHHSFVKPTFGYIESEGKYYRYEYYINDQKQWAARPVVEEGASLTAEKFPEPVVREDREGIFLDEGLQFDDGTGNPVVIKAKGELTALAAKDSERLYVQYDDKVVRAVNRGELRPLVNKEQQIYFQCEDNIVRAVDRGKLPQLRLLIVGPIRFYAEDSDGIARISSENDLPKLKQGFRWASPVGWNNIRDQVACVSAAVLARPSTLPAAAAPSATTPPSPKFSPALAAAGTASAPPPAPVLAVAPGDDQRLSPQQ